MYEIIAAQWSGRQSPMCQTAGKYILKPTQKGDYHLEWPEKANIIKSNHFYKCSHFHDQSACVLTCNKLDAYPFPPLALHICLAPQVVCVWMRGKVLFWQSHWTHVHGRLKWVTASILQVLSSSLALRPSYTKSNDEHSTGVLLNTSKLPLQSWLGIMHSCKIAPWICLQQSSCAKL